MTNKMATSYNFSRVEKCDFENLSPTSALTTVDKNATRPPSC